MSGICGIVRLDGAAVTRAELEAMVAPAAYRGRDGISYLQAGTAGLACLSLDTLRDGRGVCEPLAAPDAGVAVAATARIDNRQALCESLDEASSDGALILKTLLAYPEDAPARLLGDFAYACWDQRRGRLTLARDAMGMRSLYFRVESNRVLFASEISQLLAVSTRAERIDEQTVARYLADMQVPGGHTFYQGVEEVRQAEEVVITMTGSVSRRYFWRPDAGRRLHYTDMREYDEHFRELMADVMRSRLVTKSFMGISLSGGMDSSTAASMGGWLAEQGEDVASMQAYSWAFSRFPECDERDNIHKVAGRYAIPVHEIAAEETYPLVDLAAYRPHQDDPYMSIYHAYMHRAISAAAADGASGMMFGFRGDLMSGEAVFDITGMLRDGLYAESRRELARLSHMYGTSRLATLREHVVTPALVDLVPRRVAIHWRQLLDAGRQRAGRLSHRPAPLPTWLGERAASYVDREFLGRVGLPQQDPQETFAEHWQGCSARQRYTLINSPLASRVMQFSERLCAHYGVDFFDPWSDRRIAEFMLATPQHLITRPRQFKRLAKRSMSGIMPREAIHAARKVTPEALYLHALREEAPDIVRDLVTDSLCAAMGFVDERCLQQQCESLLSGERDDIDLWPMLSLELWLRRHW
ncbi:asparagine synthetase B family protein [Halomonas salipaludis]|uniref:asparagine synthase (glutamine-hydrolyzing) n=1 Tax=Halomonas salipaludis TaxID=2032625 RepID=A0A2A2EPX5_9GAMM|nr:asparagine synthase-related protein [Halomonas salipaludis]PAU74708.1 hypothetical protein CK498_21540 [Halomonas salipaludis]